MEEVTIVGVDLAKNVFHVHGARADGHPVLRRKLSRLQFHRFMMDLPRCLVVMEACGGAHHWAREMIRLGHDAKLIALRYVKPLVKRHKNDANDAEAIVEAATRPTMRFVEVKTEAQQERAIVFRAREQLVNQRTELVNARAHLFEFGYVAPYGIQHMGRIEEIVADEDTDIPTAVREICRGLMEQIADLTVRTDKLKKHIDAMSREAETTRRLQNMPGVGPILSLAIEAFAPPTESFRRGRDFAAWLGLVPLQKSTGGKQRLGKMSKDGTARHPQVADYRRDVGCVRGDTETPIRRIVVGTNVGAQAAHVGSSRGAIQKAKAAGRLVLHEDGGIKAVPKPRPEFASRYSRSGLRSAQSPPD